MNDTAMLQQDYNNVFHWSLQNNMLLHEDKFDLINYRVNPLSTLYELPHISKLFSYFTSSGITLYQTELYTRYPIVARAWPLGRVRARAKESCIQQTEY